MPQRLRTMLRLVALLVVVGIAGANADEFSSNGGGPSPGRGPAPSPGGGPMYGNGRYGRDPECGGTDRSYYNQMYNSTAVVLSVQRSQEIYRATGGQAWYRCGVCGNNVICWPRPGYEAMIAGTQAPTSGGTAPPQNAFTSVPGRFQLSVDENQPAATSLKEADAIAEKVIQGFKLLYGDKFIDELSQPRSHQSNVQTAVIAYLNKVAIGAIAMRLTRGQMNNFIGAAGDEIMGRLFPNALRRVKVPGFNRIADQLEGKIAREIKTGAFEVGSSRVTTEVAVDAEMVKAGYRVEWWNVRSPFGKQAFSDELVAYLQAHGIVPISHINP